MTQWNYGLTPEQNERCNKVIAEARKYNSLSVGISWDHCSNHAMEGWSIYRLPSTLNPPTIVKMRYRDPSGAILIEVDCS